MIQPIPKVRKQPRAPISEKRYREAVRVSVESRARQDRFHPRSYFVVPICEACGRVAGTEMHEGRFRSQTRNLPPDQRYSSAWCMILCHWCHMDMQEHRIEVYCEDVRAGLNGKYHVYREPCRPSPSLALYTLTEVWRAITGITA